MAQKLIARIGLAQDIPVMLVGELGYDTDLLRMRVGDGTSAAPIIMTTKSKGPFSYPSIDYTEYPEIRMIGTGTVDGVDVSQLNSADGLVTRVGNNTWAHRRLENTDGHIDIQNKDGKSGNPILNLSAAFLASIPTNFLTSVEHDTSLFGNGTAATPLGVRQATTTRLGGGETADVTEVNAGVSGTVLLTPLNLRQLAAGSDTTLYLKNLLAGGATLNGNGPPPNSLGDNGDYYLDNITKDYYGPKTGGNWPAQFNSGRSGPNFYVGNATPTNATAPSVGTPRAPLVGDYWYRPNDDVFAARINDGNSDLWLQINDGGAITAQLEALVTSISEVHRENGAGDFSSNTANGINSIQNNTTGINLTANGLNALRLNTTGQGNTAVGTFSLQANTTGQGNVGIGVAALDSNEEGDFNVAIGNATLTMNVSGVNNVAIGHSALRDNTSSANIALGAIALRNNTTGSRNTAIGVNASLLGTTADDNIAIGHSALIENLVGNQNVALGNNALRLNLANFNTAIGFNALTSNTNGTDNVALGRNALQNANTSEVTGIGSNALNSTTTGSSLVAIGFNALASNTTASHNTAVGHDSLSSVTTVSANTAFGSRTGTSLVAGSNNTFVGDAVGQNALGGGGNTAVGSKAFRENDTGNFNSVVGHNALISNTTGNLNTAMGYLALPDNTTGNNNVSIGGGSLRRSTTASSNTAVGTNTLNNISTGGNNVAVGRDAALMATTGLFNTAIGSSALSRLMTGNNNTALGATSLNFTTTGTDYDGFSNSTGVGIGSRVSGSNQIQLGRATETTYAYGAVQDRSDARDKADIEETSLGLEFISKLRPVHFRWDMRDDYLEEQYTEAEEGNISVELVKHTKDGSKKRNRLHQGVIAQELQSVCEELGIDFGGLQHHAKAGGEDIYSVGYTEFIGPLIKAVQELNEKVLQLETAKSKKK